MKNPQIKTNQDLGIAQNAFNQKSNKDYCYQATDIRLIQQELMRPYLDSFVIHEPIGDDQAVGQTLTNLITTLNENKPTLCIYNIGDWHWVVFAALKVNGKSYVLYKDSKGLKNEKLEKHIKTISDNAKFIGNKQNEQPSGVECAIYALRNMEIMAKNISQNKEAFIEQFETFQEFCNLNHAQNLRIGLFAEQYVLGKYNEMTQEAAKLSILQKIRQQHNIETEAIKLKLEETEFFKVFTIKALGANEIFNSKEKNIIAIDIVTNPNNDLHANNYKYGYRIILSANLAERVDEIFENISEVLQAYPSDVGDGAAILTEDNVTTVAKAPKIPFNDDHTHSIETSTLAENLSVSNNLLLKREVEQILAKTIDILLQNHIPEPANIQQAVISHGTAGNIPTSAIRNIIQEYTGTITSGTIPTSSSSSNSSNEQSFQEKILKLKFDAAQVDKSNSSSTTKIKQLQQIEQNGYKPLLKQLAHATTQEELKYLITILYDLGYLSKKLGDLSGELKYYTDSAIFYQYVITIIEERIDTKHAKEYYSKQIEELYNGLACVKKDIISVAKLLAASNNIPERFQETYDVRKETEANKKILSDLRSSTKEALYTIDACRVQVRETNDVEERQEYEELYVTKTRELFESIASCMQDFLARLFRESEEEIGTPPCNYTVLGLGSQALKQGTPYSDIEFAILTANEDYKRSLDPKIREYFKNLSYLVHFKIINLGETIIATSRYDQDMSSLVHRGVNFDLGGKTSLGRIDQDKPYDLVQTVEKMLWYVRNENDKASHIDKNLPYILEKVCYIHGDRQLIEEYQKRVSEFLHNTNNNGTPNCATRALVMLKEGTVEVDYLGGNSAKEITIKGDLDKLTPKLAESNGKLFDVKQEIYRLPDRLLYSLGLYYGIHSDSAWDTIDQLQAKGLIGQEAAKHLRYAVTFAMTLRLNTYLHNKGQVEDLSLFDSSKMTDEEAQKQATKMLHLPAEDLRENGGLFEYFYTALPLHQKLQEFCNKCQQLTPQEKDSFFKANNFYINDYANKGLIYYRLLQYKEAMRNFQKVEEAFFALHAQFRLRIDQGLDIYSFLKEYAAMLLSNELTILIRIYIEFGELDKAFNLNKMRYDFSKILHDNKYIVISALHLAQSFFEAGDYAKAIEYGNEALAAATNKSSDISLEHKLEAHNVLGVFYRANGEYIPAIRHLTESRKIIKQLKDAVREAGCLSNLGTVYQLIGQYPGAISFFKESEEIYQAIHKGEPNLNSVSIILNLSNAYRLSGQYDNALASLKKAQHMLSKIQNEYSTSYHIDLLNSFGQYYIEVTSYNDAKKNFNEALELCLSLYKNTPNIQITKVLTNLGITCRKLKEYELALHYQKKALVAKQLFYHHKENPNIAGSLSNIASLYFDLEEYTEALIYSLKAFRIILQFPENEYFNIIQIGFKSILNELVNNPSGKITEIAINCAIQNFNIKDFNMYIDLAQFYYTTHQLESTIDAYKLALIFIPSQFNSQKCAINHNLACMCHVAAIAEKEKGKEMLAIEYYTQADNAFKEALKLSASKVSTALYTEYANFFIAQGSFKEAGKYLVLAVNNQDTKSTLFYGALGKKALPTVLQKSVDYSEDKTITISAEHYAYYLLICYYNKFQEQQVANLATKEEYRTRFEQSIESAIERDDNTNALSCYLLALASEENHDQDDDEKQPSPAVNNLTTLGEHATKKGAQCEQVNDSSINIQQHTSTNALLPHNNTDNNLSFITDILGDILNEVYKHVE